MSSTLSPSSNGQLEDENVPPLTRSVLENGTGNHSDTQGSPRVSTVGTDEPAVPSKQDQSFRSDAADYTAPGLDSLHWAGVKKRGDYDARSVASSMAAEKDDKSIYEEPAVGAVEEEDSEEEVNGRHEDDDDDDVPEELVLPQPTDIEPSIAGSASKAGSLADATEQTSPQHLDLNRVDAPKSATYSIDADNGSVRRGSEDFEDVSLHPGMKHVAPATISPGSSIAADQHSPRSSGIPQSPMSRASVEMEEAKPKPGGYQSKTMQQLTANDEDDNLSQSADGKEEEEEAHDTATTNSAVPAAPAAAGDKSSINASPGQPAVIEHFQIEGGASGPLPVSAASPSTTGLTLQEGEQPAPVVDMGPEWENTFRGLLYYDGIDALARPVVVVNADAVPSNMRSSALIYVKAHLEPLVNKGDYIVVFSARKTRLPSLWIMSAYQNLPRPFRKNVQFVILVRPTTFLRAILAFMKPFVSTKAHKKIKTVESLEQIGEATGGEVMMMHLGHKFLQADGEEP